MKNEFYSWIWNSSNRWNYIYIAIRTGVNPVIVSQIAHGIELYHPREEHIMKLLKRAGILKQIKSNSSIK